MRKGQAHSADSRMKISLGMKGQPKSAATREKMALARAVYWARKRAEARALIALTQPLGLEDDELAGL